jgi:hypothetical protein
MNVIWRVSYSRPLSPQPDVLLLRNKRRFGPQEETHALQKKSERFRNSVSGVQLVEQGFSLIELERIEAFGEPALDRSEKSALAGVTPVAP